MIRAVTRFAFAATMVILTIPSPAQEIENRPVIVRGEENELPGAYGAPPDISHGRISTLTKAYVLPPYSIELETGYEAEIFRNAGPAHLFRQELELGLPVRFTVGLENIVLHSAGDTVENSFGIEARYALANWNRLPLNPAVSVEYRFGLQNRAADSLELSLLLSHDFPKMIEWAANIFLEQDLEDGRATIGGFAQSVEMPVLLPDEQLEIGIEMQYRSSSPNDRIDRPHGFSIGPTLVWRPSQRIRFDFSPLFGCADRTPAMQIFAVLSFSLGGDEQAEAERPTSSR